MNDLPVHIAASLAPEQELALADALQAFASGVRARGERMKGFRVPAGSDWSRKTIDELQEVAARGGAKGLAWMKIEAGGALYQRKPRPAPITAPHRTASSPVPAT